MKKILLIAILTMVFALTACSSNEKPVDNTPATVEPDNNPTVTETPDEDEVEKDEEEVTEAPGEEKEDEEVTVTPAINNDRKDSPDNDSKNQEPDVSSNNDSSSDFQVLDDLSDDLSSFQIQIDDVIYSFPMKYSDFIAHGFVMKDDDSEKLKSGYYTYSIFYKGDLRVIADIINADEKELPKSECFIGSIDIEKDYKNNGEGFFIALPKGIIYNKSTSDDVIAAYGEPSDFYEDSYFKKYTYGSDSYQRVEIMVGIESGVVDQIDVRNLIVE